MQSDSFESEELDDDGFDPTQVEDVPDLKPLEVDRMRALPWVERVFRQHGITKSASRLATTAELQFLKEVKASPHNGELRQRFIQQYLGFVVSLVMKRTYYIESLEPEDLVNTALYILLKTVLKKYDPDKGFRFTTYATWWINRELSRAIINFDKSVRLPVYVSEALSSYLKARGALEQKLGHVPTNQEMAYHLNRPLASIEKTLQALEASNPLSLEQPTESGDGGDGEGLLNFIAGDNNDDERSLIRKLNAKELTNDLLTILEVRELEAISWRFGLYDGVPHTLEETGQKMGVGRERARQIEAKALKKLRTYHRPRRVDP